MKLNTTISIDNMIALGTVICAVTLAFGFMKAEVNYIQDILELKVDKEVIELKLDIIHAELIDLKEMIIEKENK